MITHVLIYSNIQNSIYLRLLPLTYHNTITLFNTIIHKYIQKYPECKILTSIKDNKQLCKNICKSSDRNIRKIIKHIDILRLKDNANIMLSSNGRIKGPLNSLYRVITGHMNNITIKDIEIELLYESNINNGLHNSYINYIPWIIQRKSKYNNKKKTNRLLQQVSSLFSTYGILKDYEKYTNSWNFTEIANILPSYGYNIYINHEIKKNYDEKKHDSVRINPAKCWWKQLKNKKTSGDEPIKSVIYTNFLTSHRNKHILVKKSRIQIIKNKHNYNKWEYNNIKYTMQILDVKNNSKNNTLLYK